MSAPLANWLGLVRVLLVRNVIVTGGSRGLGLGIARTLRDAGYQVIAVARNQSDGLAEAIRDRNGAPGELHFMPFDLADTAAIANFVSGLRKDFGPIYGLVNNAGLGTSGVLAMMPDGDIARLVQLNTVSPILLTKYAVRSMIA